MSRAVVCRPVTLLALCGLLVAAAPLTAAGAAGVPGTVGHGAGSSVAADQTQAFQAEANNTTRHEDPGRLEEGGGDIPQVRRWLAGRFAERLEQSSVELSQGEYDRAKELVDRDTRSLFEKYVDVAGDTEGQRERVELFREARETQREYVEIVSEYRETYRAYREARRNGNTTRARRLARKLNRLAARANETGSTLQRTYDNVSETTGVSLANASRAVETTTRNVTRTQREVTAVSFTATTLVARVEEPTASFRDPLAIRGRLAMANGTAVANRRVTFRIAEPNATRRSDPRPGNATREVERRNVTVRTDAEGRFAVDYRPVALPANATRVRVAYLPNATSVFLGSNDTVTVAVRRVVPDVTVSVAPDSAGYAETISVSGRVAAADVGAPDVPVVVTVGDRRLGRTRTAPNGAFALETGLPAAIAAGDRRVTARVNLTDRALAPANGSASLAVVETETTLSVSATNATEQDAVAVTGRLTTADGVPVVDQPVAVTVGGERVRARTNATGGYYAAVPAPTAVGRTNLTVAVEYGGGGNLGPAAARTTVALSPIGDALSPLRALVAFLSGPAGAVGLLVAFLLVGGLVARYWSLFLDERDDRAADSAAASTTGDGDSAGGDERSAPSADTAALLATARDHLAAGRGAAAVRAGYAAARRRLAGDDPGERSATHWEFYRRRAGDGLAPAEADALRELTEAYERAAFAGVTVSTEDADRAVERAAALVGADG